MNLEAPKDTFINIYYLIYTRRYIMARKKNECEICGKRIDKGDCSEQYMTINYTTSDRKEDQDGNTDYDIKTKRTLICSSCAFEISMKLHDMDSEARRKRWAEEDYNSKEARSAQIEAEQDA
jgi:hypothetical protein